MEKNVKPKYFLVLKIVGFLCIAVAIAGFVFTVTGFGDVESNLFMVGALMVCIGLFAGLSCLISGFSPEFAKIRARKERYIQEQIKDDLTQISTTSAEINEAAITKTTKAVKKGLKGAYCKECGKEIDADSKFCKACGKEQ